MVVTIHTRDTGLLDYPPDTGCAAWSRCLTCPLLACLHDRAEGLRGASAVRRCLEVDALAGQGHDTAAIAVMLKVSERTVHRALAGARALGVPVRDLADVEQGERVTR